MNEMNGLTSVAIYYGLPIIGLAITSLAQLFITTSYKKYKKVDARSGQKGCEVARRILDKHGLNNIGVEEVSGNLTDHYDPTKKVVRLSTDIYEGSSIASVSVAAHECGHAVQDKVGYAPMRIRSKLVPVVNFSTKIGYLVIMIGLALGAFKLAILGVILLLGMLLFQLVTLPVEFDASRRALKILNDNQLIEEAEVKNCRKVLTAAALTYVAGVAATVLEILRLLLIFTRRD